MVFILGVILVAMLSATSAQAQQAVTQSGSVVVNHLAKWKATRQIGDAGGLTGDGSGQGLAPFSITDENGLGLCINSDQTNGPYNAFCFGHDAQSNALITVDSYNGLPGKGLFLRLNGVLYPLPGTGSGTGDVVGPPGPPFPGAGEIVLWNGGHTIKSGWDPVKQRNVIGTYIEAPAPGWGAGVLMVGDTTSKTALIGAVDNTAAPDTFLLPSGFVGYGKMSSPGNAVFGGYSLAELRAPRGSAIGLEVTVGNMSGRTANPGLPPVASIGTADAIATGLNVTCRVAASSGTNDCGLGMYIGNEQGSYGDFSFQTGLYIHLFRQYGLFVEAQPSGIQTSAVLKANPASINLQLQTVGTMVPDNAVISVVNAALPTITNFNVRQNGDIYTKGRLLFEPQTRPSVSGCGTGPSVNRSNDQGGVITAGTGTVTSCTVTFGQPYIQIPTCIVQSQFANIFFTLTARNASFFSFSSPTNFAGTNFDFRCMEQL